MPVDKLANQEFASLFSTVKYKMKLKYFKNYVKLTGKHFFSNVLDLQAPGDPFFISQMLQVF